MNVVISEEQQVRNLLIVVTLIPVFAALLSVIWFNLKER